MEKLIKELLVKIGENPERQGLIDTPARVCKMFKEIFRGYDPEQRPKISVFKNGIDGMTYDQMITDTGDFYSYCEHHIVPFFGTYWFGYIPHTHGNIIGLSKVGRVVDYYSAKLQIQERLVQEIVDDIWGELCKEGERPVGMGLVLKGEHLCKTMRGVRKKGIMTTIKLKGAFLDNLAAKEEFLSFVR